MGFFHNFSASLSPQGKHSLYVEVAHSKDRPIDKRTIVSRIIKDLCRVGLIASKDDICVQEIVDIQYGYPIYDHNYQTAREKIIQELGRYGLIPCGRYGSWKYMSMEDAILDGRSVAERALAHV